MSGSRVHYRATFLFAHSDEGDTSSDSSENEANKSGYEGPCCQPLKVPPCSPVLPQKLKAGTKKVSDYQVAEGFGN